MAARFCFVFVFFLASSIAFGIVNSLSSFSKHDLETSLGLVNKTFISLEDAYYFASSFKLSKTDAGDVSSHCTWLHSLGSHFDSAESAFYASFVSEAFGCSFKTSFFTSSAKVLSVSAKSPDGVRSLYFATKGLLLLKELGVVSDVAELKSSYQTLKSLVTGSDFWEGSDELPGLALETAAKLFQHGIASDGADVFEKGAKQLFASKPALDIASLSSSVKGAVSFFSQQAKIAPIAKPLLEASYALLEQSPSSAKEASAQLEALGLLNDNAVFVPLVADISPRISLVKSPKLEVTVSTVLGDVVPEDALTVKTTSGKVLSKAESGKYVIEFVIDPESIKLGNEEFSIAVESSSPKYAVPSKISQLVKVFGSISLHSAKISVFESGAKSPDSEFPVTLGEAVQATVSAHHLQKILVSFSVKGPSGEAYTPHQVFVKLTHEDSGVTHVFVLTSSKGDYQFKFDLLENMEKLYYLSGLYSVEVTIGDSFVENSVSWRLVTLDLDLPVAPETAQKAPETPPSLESRFQPQKEISHIFRLPEKRPPYLLSVTFVVLAIVPLVAFLLALGLLGINFGTFPSTGVPLATAVLFHVGLASILILYTSFFVQVNLFFTLKAVVVLGLVTAIPGHITLSYLANSGKEKKE